MSFRTVEHRRIEVHDGDVSIDTIVDGAGIPIVVLPSGNRDSTDMDKFASALGLRGFCVVRPQPRGMANTKAPLVGMTLSDLAHDVCVVIDQLCGGKAYILGHAYGNWIARVTATLHPDKVSGVILAAASCRNPAAELERCYVIVTSGSASREQRLGALERAFFAPGGDASIMLDGFYPHLLPHYKQANRSLPRDIWDGAGAADILDLQGECDPWRPAVTREELHSAYGDRVKISVLKGLSHALMLENADQVAIAVADWVGLREPSLQALRSQKPKLNEAVNKP